MPSLKIIMSGGGTGGHIFPAIAIAEEIKKIKPNADFLFVGAKGRMEMDKVPKAGYKIVGLWITGIQRSLSLKNLSFPFKLMSSLWKARSIVRSFKPDLVIGTGGFASGPILFAAANKKIPTLIQEQNSFAGITNKLLAKKVNKVCVAYDGMNKFFDKSKIVFTGNPVRGEVVDIDGKRKDANLHFDLDSNKKTVLVIGGSLGARSVNYALLKGIDLIKSENFQLLWQTGKTTYHEIYSATQGMNNIQVQEFIYEMDLAYAAADVVISRAGAIAVSELCLVGKPAILIPFPFAAEDHQLKNALSLTEKDAAILVKDNEAEKKLIVELLNLLNDESRQTELSHNILKLAKHNAAQNIAMEALNLLK